MTGAGADFAGVLPILGRFDVALPEWPGAALAGPSGVDGAAGRLVVKNTVAVRLLAQAAASMGDVRVHGGHLLGRLVQERGDGVDLFVGNPDVARRAGAAIAALGAAETQTAVIPGLINNIGVRFHR